MKRTRLKKGDEVIVISGAAKGSTGRIMEVMPKSGKVIVEGINVRKRAYRRGINPNYPDGGIHEKELAIDASNVMVLDPESGSGTRMGVRHEAGNGDQTVRVRYAKKSDKNIPENH